MPHATDNQPESPQPHTGPSANEGNDLPAISSELVKRFRGQIHALGAAWILLMGLWDSALPAVFSVIGILPGKLFGLENSLLFVLLTARALVWITLGVLTCLKHMWSVYMGLVFTYLFLFGRLYMHVFEQIPPGGWGVIWIIILVLVIRQAHRVIRWAKQMKTGEYRPG